MEKSAINNSISGQINSFLQKYWQPLLIGVLFIFVEWPVFCDWWKIWDEKDSYYSHGPLVPLIALFMIWINRKILAKTPIKPSWAGMVLLLISFPLHAISSLMGLRVMFMVTFFTLLFGLILLFFGWRIVKVIAIPLLFLITMIPIASGWLDARTADAQLVSATVAAKFLQWTGYAVERHGNIISGDGLPGPLRVASPCSGLRLLISLITFSWFFTYVIVAPKWKRAVLFLCSFPLSVFINSLRITMIGYVGFWIGTEEAMHSFHDYSGYIGLIVCFFILFGIARLMGCSQLETERQPASENQAAVVSKSRSSLAMFAIAFVIFGGLGYIGSAIKPLYDFPIGKINRTAIPVKFGKWASTEVSIDDETRQMLNKGDLLSRMYSDNSGRSVHVFVDASYDLMAFHDPHLCMTGSGNNIENERQLKLEITDPYRDTINATTFDIVSSSNTGVVFYWYMLGRNSYALTDDLGAVRRKLWLSDLIELLKNPLNIEGLRKKILARQFVWYRLSTDKLGDGSMDMEFIKGFARELVANTKDFGE